MKIAYYLNEGRNKNLYCRISDGDQKVTFSLGHSIDPKVWNTKREEGSDQDEYYYTLTDFKRHLEERYNFLKSEKKTDILNILKTESTAIVDGDGIQGIARNMFDRENEIHSLPKYDEFIKAFEKFSSLNKENYRPKTVGHVIHFLTDETDYEIDTYEGKIAFLKSIIDGKSYEEIYTMTNESIWSQIYIDAGIEKYVFLPVMLREWERYWDDQYKDFVERGKATAHLDKRKEFSWRQFQIYMECYDNHGDSIKLASEVDDMELYPIAVITMMEIFDAETCYPEYCELEFNSDEWESVWINEEDDNSPIFYVKELEL
jgi:hypothetical protein